MNEQYLAHWGILGMHWGVRRFQNKDGTLTPEGKRRRAQMRNESVDRAKASQDKSLKGNRLRKTVSRMSDEELQKRLKRIRDEAEYIRLQGEIQKNTVSTSRFKKIMADIGEDALKTISKKAVEKIAKNMFGQETEVSKSSKQSKNKTST